MCIAIPGKVESIDGNMAKVDFNGKTGFVKFNDLSEAKLM